MSFTDTATMVVRAGRGGDGAATVRREPYTPRGGPDGGDGGRGGDVVLEVSKDIFDLSSFTGGPVLRAEAGGNGARSNRTGAAGDDLVIYVPNGTVVTDERGLVADLVGQGARAVVAHGGRGGRGTAALSSARNRVPTVAERGEEAEEHRLDLELRMVADVGLIGLPNAGKSTLLSKLTAARPKVADYPFTTITPNLGVAGDEDERFVMADVPGLVEGASQGRGLGHRFLRHVSRSRALAYVVDLAALDPATDLATIRSEVAAYDLSLAERPSVVVGTKADLVEHPEAVAQALGADALVVSGLTGEGIAALRERLTVLAAEGSAAEPERVPYVVHRPGRPAFEVVREGRRFRVTGQKVERWVRETDLDDPVAVVELQRRLVKAGVERRLAREGARRGDEVLIAERTFEFIPDGETGDQAGDTGDTAVSPPTGAPREDEDGS